jgi:hypothetical protein
MKKVSLFRSTVKTPTTRVKMNTTQKKEEPEEKKTEDVEIKVVHEGTFAGTKEKPVLVKEGKPVPEDTADQGGGQM